MHDGNVITLPLKMGKGAVANFQAWEALVNEGNKILGKDTPEGIYACGVRE